MNVRKPATIVAAMLITAAGIAGIANYRNAAADAPVLINASTPTVITILPTITVRPTREQLRELRRLKNHKAGSAAAAPADVSTPYYSFASDTTGA